MGERRGIFTFTAAVCRALEAASAPGELTKDRSGRILRPGRLRGLLGGAGTPLPARPLGNACGACIRRDWEYDLALDSSTPGVSFWDFLPPGDARAVQRAQKLESGL